MPAVRACGVTNLFGKSEMQKEIEYLVGRQCCGRGELHAGLLPRLEPSVCSTLWSWAWLSELLVAIVLENGLYPRFPY